MSEVTETEEDMTTIATTKDAMAAARTRMEKAVDDFRKELATIRTGRANATLLDNVRVDYHGTPMPVNQLGHDDGAGPDHDCDRAVGSERGGVDRQGDSNVRTWD